jgi:hypothetical protein
MQNEKLSLDDFQIREGQNDYWEDFDMDNSADYQLDG